MNLDIHAGVVVIVLLLFVAAILTIVRGYRQFREGQRLQYFQKRRAQRKSTVFIMLFGCLILALAFLVSRFLEPAIYTVYVPSSTPTLTPTLTLTPTITDTPTPTLIPSATPIPLYTPTPLLSIIISSQFTSEVTPQPNAVFSPLSFSKKITKNYQAIDPAEVFTAPIDIMYATFTYDNMTRDAQWTALWFREGELICMESIPWNGASGGYGYTECKQVPEQWLPGNYSVQIFVGETWKQTGTFRISAVEEATES